MDKISENAIVAELLKGNKKNKTHSNESFRLLATSKSMYPLIDVGDTLVFKQIAEGNKYDTKGSTVLSPGLIISFFDKKRDEIIVHRVESIKYSGGKIYSLSTKGDNNDSLDNNNIRLKDVLGILVNIKGDNGKNIDLSNKKYLLFKYQTKLPKIKILRRLFYNICFYHG